VSSRLGLWDDHNFFFPIKICILSPKPYVQMSGGILVAVP
jgi:hypothetical protein